LPPLRDRQGDLPALVHYFVAKTARKYDRLQPKITDRFLCQCRANPWPGNVRQLAAAIDLAVIQGGELSLQRDDNSSCRTPQPGTHVIFPDILPTLAEMRDMLVAEAMRRSNSSLSEASQLLGITRWGLSKRIKKDHS